MVFVIFGYAKNRYYPPINRIVDKFASVLRDVTISDEK